MTWTARLLVVAIAIALVGCAKEKDRPDAEDSQSDADADVTPPDTPEDELPPDTPPDVPDVVEDEVEDVPADTIGDEPAADVPDEDVADAPEDGTVAVGCSVAGEASYPSPITETVTFTATADSLVHEGTLHIPEAGGTFATVILLHAMCQDRTEWTVAGRDLAGDLARMGFLVLAYDLRGFGSSTAGGTLDYCSSPPADAEFAKMPGDLEDAIAFLATRPEADLSCLGVAGSSIGANIAIIEAASDAGVDTVVGLSPGLDYFGLQPLASMPAVEPRPSLLVATTGDTYSADSVAQLAAAAAHATSVVPDGTSHGTLIFETHPAVFTQTLEWFADLL